METRALAARLAEWIEKKTHLKPAHLGLPQSSFVVRHAQPDKSLAITGDCPLSTEGVATSLRLMDDHFRGLYDNTPYAHFVYDSQKLGQVRDFATSPHIRIMIATIGALNKADINTIHKENEKTGGEKPVDLIRETHPVVIVDEPQKVDGGDKGKGREALAAMNPLCTLRYSATHKEAHHPLFRLDAVEAYERKLVKQIEVASATIESAHNRPYVKLIEVKSTKAQGIFAKIEIDDGSGKKVTPRVATVRDGDDVLAKR